MLVLAVGIVGASSAQMAAQRTRHQSALMSAAVHLAASLVERMRANPVAMALGDADNPYLIEYDAAADGPPAPASCYGDADCSPGEIAQADLYEVREALRTGFPNGRIVVCRDARTKLAWECQGAAGAPLVVKLGWRGNTGVDAPIVALVVPGVAG
ncbi:type IV pilus modification protein PilV [Massilia horti]|uniref:Type IV pilus modification protein PilV n=2 Tax=Massilia horti TaxID=2562153 RepID=A0A4Y9SXX1_9BURK|nr:type IV pilus modification protein PilV [Massilia horti]